MIWTLPNILTMGRVAAAPALALVYLVVPWPAANGVALALFVVAALTDFLDGWLARRWGQTSGFGAMLDPIADKAMVIIALAVLLGAYGLRGWLVVPVAVILMREVLVAGLREYLGEVKLPVTPLAKWKTTAQMVAVGLLFAAAWLGETVLLWFAGGLLWIAAGLTAITGWDYFARGVAYIAAKDSGRTS